MTELTDNRTISAEMAASYLKAQQDSAQIREFVELRYRLALVNEEKEMYKLFARFGYNPERYQLCPTADGALEFVERESNGQQRD